MSPRRQEGGGMIENPKEGGGGLPGGWAGGARVREGDNHAGNFGGGGIFSSVL